MDGKRVKYTHLAIINAPWNKYEVALLIDACNKVSDGVITRKEAVSQLSRRLRYAVHRKGITPSPTYRNENGIDLQMGSMYYCLTSGQKGLPNHSLLFEEISKLYNNDFSSFASLLSVARVRYPMVENYGNFNNEVENTELEEPKNESSESNNEGKTSVVTEPGNSYNKKSSLPEELRLEIKEYVFNHFDKSKESIAISNLYRIFKSKLNKCGIYTYELLKKCIKNDFPSWNFVNYKIKSIGKDKNFQLFNSCHQINSVISSDISVKENHNSKQEIEKIESTAGNLVDKICNYLKRMKTKGFKSYSLNEIFNLYRDDMRVQHLYSPSALKNKLKLLFPNWQFFSTDIILNSIGNADNHVSDDRESIVTSNNHEGSKTVNSKILSTLTKNFKNGYRLDSIIERKKFLRLYKEEHSEECPIDTSYLDIIISNLGLEFGKKVYLPDLMLEPTLRNEIESYITEMFEGGLQYINYASITQHYQDKLLDSQITSDELLKCYLCYYFPKWTYKKDFLCVNSNVEPDVEVEVFQYVKEQGCPISETAVIKALSHLPKDRIHQTFNFNSDTLIATSHSNERFHIDNFVISKNELEKISSVLYNTINEEEYTTWADLCGFIHLNNEALFTQNALISELGVRNALKVLLKSRFKFNNNIICFPNKEVSVEKIVSHYVRNNEFFTLDAITNLTSEFGTGIYWDEIVKYAVRIDMQNFVSKNKVAFSIDEIDKLLEDYCTEEYIPIELVNLFVAFPACGFQWNLFLLENYVSCYSKKYKMIHKSFQRTCVKGAIVRKKSKINTLSDIVLDQLIKAPKMYSSEEILEILKEEGYIARSRFGDIEQIIEKAKLIREN